MEKTKLINWDKVRKEMFTEEELRKIDRKADKRIAIRRLKELRKQCNITQDILAKKSGLPRTTISMIETGKRNVSISKLIQIANALDRDLEIRFVQRKK